MVFVVINFLMKYMMILAGVELFGGVDESFFSYSEIEGEKRDNLVIMESMLM